MKLWSPRSLIVRPRRRVLPPIFGGSPLLAGPFQSQWDATIPYVAGNVVFDRGGWWLAASANTNSRPISGNTDWTLVAGLPYVDVVLDPVALTTTPFNGMGGGNPDGLLVIPGTAGAILSVNWGMSVTSDGDAWGDEPHGDLGPTGPGVAYATSSKGATNLGGIDTVLSQDLSTFSRAAVTFNGDNAQGEFITDLEAEGAGVMVWSNTDITLGGTVIGSRSLFLRIFYRLIPTGTAQTAQTAFTITAVDQTAKIFTVSGNATSLGASFDVVGNTGGNDGTYTKTSTDHATKAITGVNQGTKKFTVAGDQTARFPAGVTATVAASTGNNGDYTVVAAVFGVATEIEVVEAIPDATVDGTITANTTAVVVAEAIPFTTVDGWVKQT